jgi:hypothetical protein
MRESADRTAVVTDDDEIWIRNDGSPHADGDHRWFYIGDLARLVGWIERGCPDRPDYQLPAYPWSRVVRDPNRWTGMGGRRKVEPLAPQLAAAVTPIYDYI